MYSCTHRLNHDFQLQYFMANSCRTPDAAYALLYAQKVDMETKLKHSKAQVLRKEIKLKQIQAIMDNPDSTEIEKMEAEADILEIEADKYTYEMNLKGAQNEFNCIVELMDQLESQRKYSHLDILDANEACQRDELREELKFRAENFLMSQGFIPSDHLATMRCHPDFITNILPHIGEVQAALRNQRADLVFENYKVPQLVAEPTKKIK